jgi:hypothetical protein
MKQINFEKLKQSDRIEYMLRRQEIGDFYFCTFNFCLMMIFINFLFIILALLYHIDFKSFALFNILSSFVMVIKYGVWTCIIVDIVSLIFHLKKIKKLDERFKYE